MMKFFSDYPLLDAEINSASNTHILRIRNI